MEKLIEDFQIPNKKIETWKYTDLKKVFEKNNFEPLIKPDETKTEPVSIDSNISNNIFFDPEVNFVIFENGCLEKINIKSNDLEIESLNNNLENKVFNKKNFTRNDSLLDINSAFLNDNLVIKDPRSCIILPVYIRSMIERSDIYELYIIRMKRNDDDIRQGRRLGLRRIWRRRLAGRPTRTCTPVEAPKIAETLYLKAFCFNFGSNTGGDED